VTNKQDLKPQQHHPNKINIVVEFAPFILINSFAESFTIRSLVSFVLTPRKSSSGARRAGVSRDD